MFIAVTLKKVSFKSCDNLTHIATAPKVVEIYDRDRSEIVAKL